MTDSLLAATMKDTAKRLGIPYRSLASAAQRGDVNSYRTADRHRMVLIDADLEAYMVRYWTRKEALSRRERQQEEAARELDRMRERVEGRFMREEESKRAA